ncbi:MAG: Beta-glucuronidase [Flavobacteriaceae bacterium]|nr:MAG: Beta-glucuronidase [Flavobacteriaceae bacterium]
MIKSLFYSITGWLFFCHLLMAQPHPKDIALFPQENSNRSISDLSGIWEFKKDPENIGIKNQWFNGLTETRSIAVPGSWNEQFTDSRDYLDAVWYQTEAFVPENWSDEEVWIRFGSVNYHATVWVNGQQLGIHEGGHLPFAFDISKVTKTGEKNTIVVRVENELKPSRVPTGNVPNGFFSNYPKSNFDFFPYAGINRKVWLYTLPKKGKISDLTVKTNFEKTTGKVTVAIEKVGAVKSGEVILTGDKNSITKSFKFSKGKATVEIDVPQVNLWSIENPFLYDLKVVIKDNDTPLDQYQLPIGIRTVAVNEKTILLNGEPVFLKGFGKHEDFPIFGRGVANPVIVKDYALLKWIGANSYRTSHYPYDEEYYRMADREGILIIDEIPAVGLFFHGDKNDVAERQRMCKQYLEELYYRDKNHPSVIMWCVANEPFPEKINFSIEGGEPTDPDSIVAFQELFDLIRSLDNTRLTTLVGVMGGPLEWIGLADVICINRYWGWYAQSGEIAKGAAVLNQEIEGLYSAFKKPIIVSEFGVDTYPGMHAEQPEMFTEEYQKEFIKAYLDVADSKEYVTGMHIWAFADFKTTQGIIRFGGMNYKGVFTRDRKPKMAAHYLKERWTKEE